MGKPRDSRTDPRDTVVFDLYTQCAEYCAWLVMGEVDFQVSYYLDKAYVQLVLSNKLAAETRRLFKEATIV